MYTPTRRARDRGAAGPAGRTRFVIVVALALGLLTTLIGPSWGASASGPSDGDGGTLVWTTAAALAANPTKVAATRSLGTTSWVAQTGFLPGMGGTNYQQTTYRGLPAKVGQR